MSYFEEIGVEFQYNARNIFEANKAFEKSCTRCSTAGKHLNCDKCHIASAHNTVALIFNNKTITI